MNFNYGHLLAVKDYLEEKEIGVRHLLGEINVSSGNYDKGSKLGKFYDDLRRQKLEVIRQISIVKEFSYRSWATGNGYSENFIDNTSFNLSVLDCLRNNEEVLSR